MADNDDVKAPRKSGRVWKVLVVIVVVALVGALGYLALRALDRPRAAKAQLANAAAMLSQAEPDVLAIDSAVRSEVTSALADAATEAYDTIDPTEATLTEALGVIADARADLADEDVALADALESAITSRMDMLDEAKIILATDKRAATVVGPAAEAWQLVADAEKLSDSAVAQYNKHTKAGVSQSTSLTVEAETKLTAGRSALGTVTADFAEADMSPFVAYIDGKLKLLASSKKIDATWLAGKVEDANKLLDAYNAEEKKVIALADKLPESPTAVVAAAYEALTSEAITRYFDARDAARTADAAIKAIGDAQADKK